MMDDGDIHCGAEGSIKGNDNDKINSYENLNNKNKLDLFVKKTEKIDSENSP